MINLKGNEHLLDAVLEYCDDIITVKDLNLNYVACNKAFLKILNKGPNTNITGKSVYEVLPQSCIDTIVTNAKRVIEELRPQSYTLILDQSGTTRIIKQTTTPVIRNGVVESILTVSSDATNEENLKAKLIEKNYQLNTLLENIPYLVYMKDKNKNIVVASEKSKKFLYQGIDNFESGLHLDMGKVEAETSNEDNYVIENKKDLVKEKIVPGLDRKAHHYRIHKAPILTESNDVTGLVTIAKNIDIEKQQETQKNLFLATLSHDLKNPLQAQISSLEMFNKQFADKVNDEQKEILELIIESAKYMRNMLCTLLSTCKDNYGVIKLERKDFDIEKILIRSVKEIKNLATERKLKLETSIKTHNNIVFADELQIRRVINNLLNNAVNYAYENSSIEIDLTATKESITIGIENQSDIIPENIKSHIFDKFVCGDKLQSNARVGLGLYFCKKIVEAHEGEVSLEANGTSNRFVIEIPFLNKKNAQINEVVL